MVSHTAQVLAARRALAYRQGCPLCTDSYASMFVTPKYEKIACDTDDKAHYVLMRHRVLEDYYLEQSARGRKQVVLLGAGFDTKRQRYPKKYKKHIEVETVEMVKHKCRILEENGMFLPETLSPRGTAIEQFDQILRGTDPDLATVFIAEGYFMYFELEQILSFFERAISYYSVNPAFGFDMISDSYPDNPRNKTVIERIRKTGEKVLSCCSPSVLSRILTNYHLEVDLCSPSILQRRYLNSVWEGEDDKFVILAS